MKRRLLIFCCLSMFCVSSCGKDYDSLNSEQSCSANSSEVVHNNTNEQVTNTKDIINKNSEIDINELITKSYSQKDIIQSIDYLESDNFNTMLDWINKKYPIECIRTFENSLTYCVYKLKEGGSLFVYFRGDSLKFANYIFVIKDSLSNEAFSVINKGDSLEEVESIDKGTQLINSIKRNYLNVDPHTTYHMVKEGFVKITYIKQTSDTGDSFTVDTISFIENGKELIDYNGELLSCKFLEQDYPK